MAREQAEIEECYANNYDHFTYELDLIKKLKLNPERIETLGKYSSEETSAGDKLKAYRTKVSDHVPIKLSIDLK